MDTVRGHVWYSTSSAETAKPLAAGLQYSSGRKAPSMSNYDILVNWGCRPSKEWSSADLDKRIEQGKIRVLNHPAYASDARDKLGMLSRLRESLVPTPGFVSLASVPPELADDRLLVVRESIESGVVNWPVLCFNRMNRGQPAFCYNYDELMYALANEKGEKPIDYVRSLTDGAEYRVHTFRDTVLAAQMKVMSDNPVKTVAEALFKKVERQRERAEAEGEKPVASDLSRKATQELVNYLSEELLLGPTHFQRTIGRGCELLDVPLEKLDMEVRDLAVQAIDALHLDMGAVHVMGTGPESKMYVVTNVVTNPGLDPGLVAQYVEAIEKFAGGESKEKEIPAPSGDTVGRPELVAALHRRVDSLSVEELQAILGGLK